MLLEGQRLLGETGTFGDALTRWKIQWPLEVVMENFAGVLWMETSPRLPVCACWWWVMKNDDKNMRSSFSAVSVNYWTVSGVIFMAANWLVRLPAWDLMKKCCLKDKQCVARLLINTAQYCDNRMEIQLCLIEKEIWQKQQILPFYLHG